MSLILTYIKFDYMVTHSNVIPTTANKHQMKYKLLVLHIEFQYIPTILYAIL